MQMFNGFYTVKSPTGQHRTFRVFTQAEGDSFAAGQRIISMLTGQDNELDYTGFGFVTKQGIKVWKNKRGADGAPSQWDLYAKMLWDLSVNGEKSPYTLKGVEVLLDKRCRRCNRRLTNPTSIESGIGPECAGRIGIV